ncbi:dicarboxylate/amino acid:cation symporter [Algicola sagamiensis]|uniref:dicarboxylate/amino acid:cation symporter n=1 Tax=Algicola sagamiensis TaxID=163869 RepID=UPI000373C6AD|nr:dicarboxylate/amino acid:cation symporter [Algicola sagamiensis]
MLKQWFTGPFWRRVLVAFVLGAGLGLALNTYGQPESPSMLYTALTNFAKGAGDLFIHAIKMLVVPLVLFSIISSITSVGQQGIGRMGVKTISMFLTTALIASGIGLLIGSLMNFETNIALVAGEQKIKHIPPVHEVLTNIIPTNPFRALMEGNILQIVFMAVLIGLSINALKEKAAPAKRFFEVGTEIMYQITRYVLQLTPIGVFGLMAWMLSQLGIEALYPLVQFIVAIYIACFIHIFLIYGGFVKVFTNTKLIDFYRHIFPAQLVAYTTASSYGTLPATTKAVESLGVKKKYSSFILPLGATINMDGCGGIYPAIAAIFIAHIFQVPLEFTDYILIALTATLASVGTAGVPGTAMVMLTVTLNVVGLPLEGIAYIAAIDRIIDMMRTATNITGDAMVSLVIHETEERVALREPSSVSTKEGQPSSN